ncbi:hypothetical protein KCP91_08130 [Microvirga sp. SRT01]|uniref:DUF6950 domain-containing protein n=1 Tax=Sphingomonas longa TaxID=2778730 RepID=A0ABS2D5Y8_9SPHN|nr:MULTISPECIES: hypothetical protein [Alphaproteobacteria]MBM6576338.1 hypothetical protein [Sphingomonas sp. BT552]MBR7709384.1 hypothetical protein [Microvirga sp. SRT01]
MHRKPDWEARLAAYLDPLRLRAFAWGRHDCCTFAAGAVEAMTGVDPMPEFRGHYTTARGSVRALRRIGRGTLAATLDAKFESVEPSLAQRGDIIMSSGLLGICFGAFLIAVGREGEREGLIRIDRPVWVEPRAWRVQYGS